LKKRKQRKVKSKGISLMKFTFLIKVFGCQMNYSDAERITALLKKRGGKPSSQKADLSIAVGCGVRQSADERAVSWVKKTKENSPKTIAILTGCLSNREDIQKRLKGKANLFIPIEEWNKACDKLRFPLEEHCPNFYNIRPRYSNPFSTLIPIMTGCNNFCSYCVVPYARGREKSFSPEKIVEEVNDLIKKNCKEITLLGQNVNSYAGVDKSGKKWNFSKLIKAINNLEGDFWIKFVSSHPKDINDEFINTLNLSKVSSHLHLPVQSGSNRVLKLMNRKYTREEYLKLVDKIRSKVPNLILTSDFIVGFPDESENDFKNSLDIAKKAEFEMLYINRYSPRPNTKAFKLKDNVPQSIKRKREKRLDEIWKKITEERNKKYVGEKVRILVDKIKVRNGKRCVYGHTYEYKKVRAESRGKVNTGDFVNMNVGKISAIGLEGRVI